MDNISDVYKEMACQSPNIGYEDASQIFDKVDPTTSGSCELTHNFNETFPRSICLFYLKSQWQLLCPPSTIQITLEEKQNLHDLGKDRSLVTYMMGKS